MRSARGAAQPHADQPEGEHGRRPAEGNTLRLSGLPELRSCTLDGWPELALNMRINAASFQAVRQLQSLHVSDEALQLERESLVQLTLLTSLTLAGCALYSVPADVASLSATLCELCFNRNDQLQIDWDAVSSILQCSRLKTLQIHKDDINKLAITFAHWSHVVAHLDGEQYTPSQWSSDSVSNLLQLSAAFCRRHGRDLEIDT